MNKTKRQEEATRFSFDYLKYFLQQEGVVERMVERKMSLLESRIDQMIDEKINQRIKQNSNK